MKAFVGKRDKDFEWLVVDDGSRDNTKELINSFMAEGRVNIRYIYQENGGKQRAINRGVHSAKGDLFFIVDSDDFITSDAIEKISSSWNEIRNNGKYAGSLLQENKNVYFGGYWRFFSLFCS